jgi:hypothetical protein
MLISQYLFIAALGASLITSANAQVAIGGGTIHPIPPPAPPNVVTMVCHESGGSGYPLTDYVNNVDVAVWNAASQSYTTSLPNGFVIYPETSSNPTSCAVATSQLQSQGFFLKQAFSHFPGYYIEVFSTEE